MDRIHISNHDGKAFFGVSKDKKGKQGDVKKATFFGQSISVSGIGAKGQIIEKKFNKGSLIDFLNTELEKQNENLLEKGWFIHASDGKVRASASKISY